MEENVNVIVGLIVGAVLWCKLSYDAGRRKGHLEGRKAVRKHYEQVGR